jgi:hypothetical protein
MATIKVYQGDSFGKDYYSAEVPNFSLGWIGDWVINDSVGVMVSSGDLSVSADFAAMQLRIPPASNEIPVGEYMLVVQVQNDGMEFKKEIEHSKYIIKAQGLP